MAVSLKLSKSPEKLVDMGRLKEIELKKDSLKIAVPAYSLLALRFANSAEVINGTIDIPKRQTAALAAELNRLKAVYLVPIKIHVKEKTGKKYIWFEAENWDKWDCPEKYDFQRNHHKNDYKGVKFVSGGDSIGFGGNFGPVIYNLKTEKAGKYYFWVRFTFPSPGQTSKWEGTVNGSKIGECTTPVRKGEYWVKLGEADLSAGGFKFGFAHKSVNFSYLVDSFLITDDSGYVPKGLADTRQRILDMNKIFSPAEKQLKLKHMAKARALIALIKGNVKEKGE
jgi:hypothetical protein